MLVWVKGGGREMGDNKLRWPQRSGRCQLAVDLGSILALTPGPLTFDMKIGEPGSPNP